MPQTTNFEVDHIDATVNQKEVVANHAIVVFDGAIGGYLNVVFPAADVTLTKAQALRAMGFHLTAGAIAANQSLIVPSNNKLYFIINRTGFTITVKISGQTGVAVSNNNNQLLYCDATGVGDVIAVSAATT